MFVHDGLVHKRFPVGPIADVPYLRKVAAAHQVYNSLTWSVNDKSINSSFPKIETHFVEVSWMNSILLDSIGF